MHHPTDRKTHTTVLFRIPVSYLSVVVIIVIIIMTHDNSNDDDNNDDNNYAIIVYEQNKIINMLIKYNYIAVV